jgi:ABC-type uncharacterized transport system YnjBCD ATPase subunit
LTLIRIIIFKNIYFGMFCIIMNDLDMDMIPIGRQIGLILQRALKFINLWVFQLKIG